MTQSPQTINSNLSEWLELIGFTSLPDWIYSPYINYVGYLIFGLSSACFLGIFISNYRKKRRIKSQLNEANRLFENLPNEEGIDYWTDRVDKLFSNFYSESSNDYKVYAKKTSNSAIDAKFSTWLITRQSIGKSKRGRIPRDFSINHTDLDWNIFCLELLIKHMQTELLK